MSQEALQLRIISKNPLPLSTAAMPIQDVQDKNISVRWYRWINGKIWHLHVTVDDADGRIVGAYF